MFIVWSSSKKSSQNQAFFVIDFTFSAVAVKNPQCAHFQLFSVSIATGQEGKEVS